MLKVSEEQKRILRQFVEWEKSGFRGHIEDRLTLDDLNAVHGFMRCRTYQRQDEAGNVCGYFRTSFPRPEVLDAAGLTALKRGEVVPTPR